MNNLLLVSIPTLPLLLALLSAVRRSGLLLIGAPAVALVAALLLPVDSSVHLPWLLLGVHWQLDAVAQMFLKYTALVWLIAALFVAADARERTRSRVYHGLFLSAMAGNLLLIVAADMISFYIGFAIMGLSAYGLILKRSQRTRRAARVYLGFTLVGEFALFAALLLIASSSGTLLFAELRQESIPDLAVALLLVGFGIKLALPGLHPWLPLVYSSAPLVSVALLSGPMMKAGLLGWMRFLPAENVGLAGWGELLMLLGLIGLVAATVLALAQPRPSAILAYSSVAKMGFISLLFGYALVNPQDSQAILAVLVLFAMHHLLIKSALFLGLRLYHDRYARPAVYTGMAVLALSLAGIPWSGGAAVKMEIAKAAVHLDNILLLTGFSGALMMVAFLYRLRLWHVRGPSRHTPGPYRSIARLGWWLLLPLAVWAPFSPLNIEFELKGALVIVVAAAVLLLLHRLPTPAPSFFRYTRPGDIYHLLRQLRLQSPVLFRQKDSSGLTATTQAPISENGLQTVATGLVKPGLAWLLITLLIFTALFVPFF